MNARTQRHRVETNEPPSVRAGALSSQELIDALDVAIAIATSEGVVLKVNRSFERMLGYSRADLPFVPPLPWQQSLNGADELAPDRALEELRAIASQAQRDPDGTVTVTLRHIDGREMFANVSLSPLDTDQGPGFIAMMRDVTADLHAVERDTALGNLAMELASETTLEGLARLGLDRILELFEADYGGLRYDDTELDLIISDPSQVPVVTEALKTVMSTGSVVITTESQPENALVGTAAAMPSPNSAVCSAGAPLFGGSGALWMAWENCRPFGAEDRALFTALCAQLGQAIQRATLDIERKRFATSIQQSILSSTHVPEHAAVRYVPALVPLEVGGDWYDIVGLGRGTTGLVVGDCVGRGVDAASTMIKLRSASRALLLRSSDPVEVLDGLDEFATTVVSAFCATAMVGVLESDGCFTWTSAGHIPGLLLRVDGTVEILDQAQSAPLGAAKSRREHSVLLQRGDRLIFCSDGLIERRGEAIDDGISRLANACQAGRVLPVDTMAQCLIDALQPSVGYTDDVALIVFEHCALPMLEMTVPADFSELTKIRSELSGWLGELGADSDTVQDIILAVTEAASNAMEHSAANSTPLEPVATDPVEAGPARSSKMSVPTASPTRQVELHAFTDGTKVTIELFDHGTWRPADNSGRSLNRGRGLAIMRAVMDSSEVDTNGEGTRVTMSRRLSRA